MAEKDKTKEEKVVDLSKRTMLRTGLVAGGMFGFGFAMVPIYDVFCKVTGLNGKTDPNPYTGKAVMDTSRIIKVQFVATKNAGMSWDFHPDISEVEVHPGQVGELSFYAHNPTSERMIGQAIPSVTPFQATNYLHKVECFCFTTQTLDAGEEKVMPLRIIVDQELPRHITKLTLSYTLFDVTTMGERTLKS